MRHELQNSSGLTIRIVSLVPGVESLRPEPASGARTRETVWAVCLYDLRFAMETEQPLQSEHFALWFPQDQPVSVKMQDATGPGILLPASDLLRAEILERPGPSVVDEEDGALSMQGRSPDVVVLADERAAHWIIPNTTDPVRYIHFVSVVRMLFPELSGVPDAIDALGHHYGFTATGGAHPGSAIARIHVLARIIEKLLAEHSLDELLGFVP
ncbi:hypothetical protein AA0312_1379 [Acetobacter tropicalis NRIC 0312]|uniref:Uncharacterized protein n=1 Tax=Acetobacter tropicalis TaxID=104102 RepID=A0A511FRP2_9PROT|nr:hypothetical protein [Acetobacter tropicalis]KXV51266.1 hypothetical protein AD944_02435 [Acetobacter tropicalis]GAL98823.1 hypothetical protein B932_0571 [Acetobacter tropicalis]GBR69407.1 hypothetical protein AA0312_1379 [Acetobacter tropicalis NRIC 0312]GEL51619.1 hypothetical protein ATR01nite_26940 [Acetobacter tropicalis]